MRSRIVLAAIVLLAATAPVVAASAQFPPARTKNLKVLPSDIPVASLIDTMRAFTRALGARCTYCHVGKEGQPLDSFDFAADAKEPKEKARVMLRMVQHINGEHLGELPSRREPPVIVSCATCHRGIAVPRPLQQVILAAYDSAGADTALARYDALRKRYYGRATYDFGEVTLVDVAEALQQRDRVTDAMRFYVLNTEVNPTSGFALRQLAEAQMARGDTSSAVASLTRALELNANDRQAKETLETLRKGRTPQ